MTGCHLALTVCACAPFGGTQATNSNQALKPSWQALLHEPTPTSVRLRGRASLRHSRSPWLAAWGAVTL